MSNFLAIAFLATWARYGMFHFCTRHADAMLVSLDRPLGQDMALTLADLLPHAQRLGGADAADHTARGALHRGWMVLKAALSGSDDRAIISEAEHSEDLALAAYNAGGGNAAGQCV